MKWLVPREKLDEFQKAWLDELQKELEEGKVNNWWIRGFPGSGKSVLVAYSIEMIHEKCPNASIALAVFTHSLVKLYEEASQELKAKVTIKTYYQILRSNIPYDFIIVDEVQDVPQQKLLDLKNLAGHIIVAGDENQSIYDKDPLFKLPPITPAQILPIINGQSESLNIIHRLTQSVINIVKAFLPGLNLFNSRIDATKDDVQVRLKQCSNNDKECSYIREEAEKAINNANGSVAVLFPTHRSLVYFINTILQQENVNINIDTTSPKWKNGDKIDYNKINRLLSQHSLNYLYVGNGYGNFMESNKIIMMTYRSSKGLDFDYVFMPYLDQSLYITPDPVLSKTCFMVALTRSRLNLYLTYSGLMHPYVASFSGQCISPNVTLNNNANTNQNPFGFNN